MPARVGARLVAQAKTYLSWQSRAHGGHESSVPSPHKSRRTTSSIRIEEAAQIAGERAGQIKSNSKLRRATKADLEANSLQDMQHLLRKMAKTFFLARCVLSEDGTRRECRIIPCSGIEAFVTFSPSLSAEK